MTGRAPVSARRWQAIVPPAVAVALLAFALIMPAIPSGASSSAPAWTHAHGGSEQAVVAMEHEAMADAGGAAAPVAVVSPAVVSPAVAAPGAVALAASGAPLPAGCTLLNATSAGAVGGAVSASSSMMCAPLDGDWGPTVGSCVPGPTGDGMMRTCIGFPTGTRALTVPIVVDSFGESAPPAGTVFADTWTPGQGECPAALHDRYWVLGPDGKAYRTWHPPTVVNPATGQMCSFGHEHGDDPRTSALYFWAGGVPFGYANAIYEAAGGMRHEDHFGHKVVVANAWQAVIGNPPGDEYTGPAGFTCYWLSKLHQGTHSGDSLTHNLHEYFNNVMCDDGAVRHPDAGRTTNTGPSHHTEASIKMLAPWGTAGAIEACDDSALVTLGSLADGVALPVGHDSHRDIKCANPDHASWTYKQLITATTGPGGAVDFSPSDAGLGELWKPWARIMSRDNQLLFLSTAYYIVNNPARVYNDGAVIPLKDMNGDGTLDKWLPTLDVCLWSKSHPAYYRSYAACGHLPTFPATVPQDQWWKLPGSPFDGTQRAVHPKGVALWNATTRSRFCTDALGQETAANATQSASGRWSCPAGQVVQVVADTQNLWSVGASWGTSGQRGSIQGSMVNFDPAGDACQQNVALKNSAKRDYFCFGHEWVRFFDAPGVHAPN